MIVGGIAAQDVRHEGDHIASPVGLLDDGDRVHIIHAVAAVLSAARTGLAAVETTRFEVDPGAVQYGGVGVADAAIGHVHQPFDLQAGGLVDHPAALQGGEPLHQAAYRSDASPFGWDDTARSTSEHGPQPPFVAVNTHVAEWSVHDILPEVA